MKALAYALSTLILLPTIASANITVEEVRIGTNGTAKEEEVLPIATEVILNSREGRIISSIPYRDSVGSFRIPIISRITTKVKVRFTDPHIGMVSDSEKYYKLKANRAANFVFAAYQATKGHIEILNENDEVILTVPYIVTSNNGRNQSVNFSANKKIGGDGDNPIRLTTGFRASQRHNNVGRGVTSFGVSTSTDTNFEELNVNINFSYSWD